MKIFLFEIEENDIPELAGIYKITNIINDKFYIGSTVDFRQRKAEHKCDLNLGNHNQIMNNAYKKYGKDVWTFEIIEVIKNLDSILDREQWYLDNWKPHYNVSKKAMSIFLGKTAEEIKEIRIKMALKHRGEGNPMWNKPRLDLAEYNRTIKKGRKVSRKELNRINEARRRKVIQKDLNGNIIAEFKSITYASKVLKLGHSTISRLCKEEKIKDGYILSYLIKEIPLSKNKSKKLKKGLPLENRVSKKGIKTGPISQERRESLRKTSTTKKAVNQLDENNNIINTFESVAEAARQIGILKSNISGAIKHIKNQVYAGGYKWEFLNKKPKE